MTLNHTTTTPHPNVSLGPRTDLRGHIEYSVRKLFWLLGLHNVTFSLKHRFLLIRNRYFHLPVPLSEDIRRVTESLKGERFGCTVSLRAPDGRLRSIHIVGSIFSAVDVSVLFLSFSCKMGLTLSASVHTSAHIVGVHLKQVKIMQVNTRGHSRHRKSADHTGMKAAN